MITTFNRVNLQIIRNDLNLALAHVAQKHGLNLVLGNIRFSATEFRAALNARTNTAPVVTGPTEYQGLKVGDKFMYRFEEHTIIDFKPSRPKYPILAKNSKGKELKFPIEVANYLIPKSV